MLDWSGMDEARDVVGSGTEAVRRNCNSANHSIPPNLAASAVPTASGTCTSWAKWLSLWRPDANADCKHRPVGAGSSAGPSGVPKSISIRPGRGKVRTAPRGAPMGPAHHRRARSSRRVFRSPRTVDGAGGGELGGVSSLPKAASSSLGSGDRG